MIKIIRMEFEDNKKLKISKLKKKKIQNFAEFKKKYNKLKISLKRNCTVQGNVRFNLR